MMRKQAHNDGEEKTSSNQSLFPPRTIFDTALGVSVPPRGFAARALRFAPRTMRSTDESRTRPCVPLRAVDDGEWETFRGCDLGRAETCARPAEE